MAKHLQALALCVPIKPGFYQHIQVMSEITASLGRRLDLKAGGLIPIGSYIEGKGYYSHFNVYAEDLPSSATLERWSMMVLERFDPSLRKKR